MMLDSAMSENDKDKVSEKDTAENVCYFSVNVPEDVREETIESYGLGPQDEANNYVLRKKLRDEIFIYHSVDEVVYFTNSIKTARFKRFSSIEEAIKFAALPHSDVISTSSDDLINKEEHSFPRLSRISQAKFCSLVEENKLVLFMYAIWRNPYSMVTNLDMPIIVQAASKYNIMHQIATMNYSLFCTAILGALRNMEVLKKMYPKDDLNMLKIKQTRLIDIFLNMPDRTYNETPLHYACKFGSQYMVRVLLAQDECDRNIKNVFGYTAQEIICEKLPIKQDLLEDEIQEMFEGSVYLSVIRYPYSTGQPVIGKQCTEAFVLKTIYGGPEASSEFDGRVYTAFIGPLTFQMAEQHYRLWCKKDYKTLLSPKEASKLKDICMTDPHRGLERVARIVAVHHNLGFIEYIPELHMWFNFNVDKLRTLEDFLFCINKMNVLILQFSEDKKCKALLKFLLEKFFEEFAIKPNVLKLESYFTCPYVQHELLILTLCQALLPYMYCLTSFSFSNVKERRKIHDEIGHILFLHIYFELHPKKLFIFFMQLNLKIGSLSAVSNSWEHALCILKFAWYHHLTSQAFITDYEEPECQCQWKVYENFDFCSSDLHRELVIYRQNFFNTIQLLNSYNKHNKDSTESEASVSEDSTESEASVSEDSTESVASVSEDSTESEASVSEDSTESEASVSEDSTESEDNAEVYIKDSKNIDNLIEDSAKTIEEDNVKTMKDSGNIKFSSEVLEYKTENKETFVKKNEERYGNGVFKTEAEALFVAIGHGDGTTNEDSLIENNAKTSEDGTRITVDTNIGVSIEVIKNRTVDEDTPIKENKVKVSSQSITLVREASIKDIDMLDDPEILNFPLENFNFDKSTPSGSSSPELKFINAPQSPKENRTVDENAPIRENELRVASESNTLVREASVKDVDSMFDDPEILNFPLENFNFEKNTPSGNTSPEQKFVTAPQSPISVKQNAGEEDISESEIQLKIDEWSGDGFLLFSRTRELSSLDIDIYRSIESHIVNPKVYPLLSMWMTVVEGKLEEYFSSKDFGRTTSLASEAIVKRIRERQMTT